MSAGGKYESQYVSEYRDYLKGIGRTDLSEMDDRYLTGMLVDDIIDEQNGGMDFSSFPDDFRVAARHYLLEAPEDYKNRNIADVFAEEFSRGVSSGIDTMQGGYKAAGGLLAGAVGFEDTEAELMKSAGEEFQQAQREGSSMRGKMNLAWEQLVEEGDFGPFGRWLSSGAGEALASGIDMLVGVTTGVGAAAAGGRMAAKKIAMKEVKDIAERKAKVNAQAAKYGTAGATAGSMLTSGSQNTGHVYEELYGYTQLPKDDPLYMSPAEARTKSLVTGAVMGSLDSVVPVLLTKTLGKKMAADSARGVVSKMIKGMPEGTIFTKELAKDLGKTALGVAGTGATEAGTEALQETIQMSVVKDHTGEDWTKGDYNRLIEAGALGFLGGAQMKVAGNVIGAGVDVNRELGDQRRKQEAIEAVKKLIETPEGKEYLKQAERKINDLSTNLQVDDTVVSLADDKSYKVTHVDGGRLNLESLDGGENIEGVPAIKYRKSIAKPEEQTEETEQTEEEEEAPEKESGVVDQKLFVDGNQVFLGSDKTIEIGSFEKEETDDGITLTKVNPNVAENFEEKQIREVVEPALQEEASKKKKAFRVGDGDWVLPYSFDPAQSNLSDATVEQMQEFLDLTHDPAENSPYNSDKAKAIRQKIIENNKNMLVEGIPVFDPNLSAQQELAVAATYNSAVNTLNPNLENKVVTEQVNTQINELKNPKARSATKTLLGRRDDFKTTTNNRLQYTGGLAPESPLTSRGGQTPEQKAAQKRQERIEKLRTKFETAKESGNELWNINQKPSRYIEINDQGTVTVERLDENNFPVREDLSLEEIPSKFSEHPKKKPSVEIKNGKLQPKRTEKFGPPPPPPPPKKKTIFNIFSREDPVEDGEYPYVKLPGKLPFHIDSDDVFQNFAADPILALIDGQDTAIGYRNKDGDPVYLDNLPDFQVLGGKKIKGIPLFSNSFELAGQQGRFVDHFNRLVAADSFKKGIEVYQPTQRPLRGSNSSGNNSNSPKKLQLNFPDDFKAKEFTNDKSGVSELQEVDYDNLAAELWGFLERDMDDDVLKAKLQEKGILKGQSESLSRLAIVVESETGGIAVRSIFYHTQSAGSKNRPNDIGYGPYVLKIYQSTLRDGKKDKDKVRPFVPFALSNQGNQATDAFLVQDSGTGSFVQNEDKSGNIIIKGSGFRVLGLLTFDQKAKISSDFVNLKALNEAIETQNKKALENGPPYGRFKLGDKTEEIAEGDEYNPHAHLYLPTSQKEEVLEQFKEFAKRRLGEIEAALGEDETNQLLKDYASVLQQVQKTGLMRVRDFENFEDQYFAQKNLKPANARKNNYSENFGILNQVRLQAVKDKPKGQSKPHWFSEPKKYENNEQIKNILDINEEVVEELRAKFTQIYEALLELNIAKPGAIMQFLVDNNFDTSTNSLDEAIKFSNQLRKMFILRRMLDDMELGNEMKDTLDSMLDQWIEESEIHEVVKEQASPDDFISALSESAFDSEYQDDVITIPEGAGDLFMELANEAMQVENLSDWEVFGTPPVRSSNFTSQGSGNNLFYLPKDVLLNPQRTAQLKKQLKETAKRLDERYNLGVFESTLKRRQDKGFKGGLFNEVQAMGYIYDAIKNPPPKKDIQGSALQKENIPSWAKQDFDDLNHQVDQAIKSRELTIEEFKFEIEQFRRLLEQLEKSLENEIKLSSGFNDNEQRTELIKKAMRDGKISVEEAKKQLSQVNQLQTLSPEAQAFQDEISTIKESIETLEKSIDNEGSKPGLKQQIEMLRKLPEKAVRIVFSEQERNKYEDQKNKEDDVEGVRSVAAQLAFPGANEMSVMDIRNALVETEKVFSNALSISNFADFSNAIKELAQDGDIENENDANLAGIIQNYLEQGGNGGVMGLGNILSKTIKNLDVRQAFISAWMSDADDATGTNVLQVLKSEYIERTQEDSSFQINDSAGMEADSFGITTGSETQLAGISPEQVKESEEVIKEFLSAFSPDLPLSGKLALRRALELATDQTIIDSLEMLMSNSQLDTLDINFASHPEWERHLNELRKSNTIGGKSVRHGEYSAIDQKVTMGSVYGSMESAPKEERMAHLLRVLAEELQHAVTINTINALVMWSTEGKIPRSYKGNMSIADFEAMAGMNTTVFNFLKEHFASKGVFKYELSNPAEMWAAYATDAKFRTAIDKIKMPQAVRAKLRTRLQRLGDFFRRVLARIFSGISEASPLEMMDIQLKKFYKDSNRVSIENDWALGGRAKLGSQLFLDFAGDTIETESAGPTYQQMHNIPEGATIEEASKILIDYYEFEDLADIEGTALIASGYLGFKPSDMESAMRRAYANRFGLGSMSEPIGNETSEFEAVPLTRNEVEQNMEMEYVSLLEVQKVVENALNEFLSTEEASKLDNDMVKKVMRGLSKVNDKATNSVIRSVRKALNSSKRKGQRATDPAAQAQEIERMAESKDIELKESISSFETLALKLKTARDAVRKLQSQRRHLVKRMQAVEKDTSDQQKIVSEVDDQLTTLAKGKKYDPDAVKKQIEKDLIKTITDQRYLSFLGPQYPEHSRKKFKDSLQVDRVYEVLSDLINQDVVPEDMTKQEIFDALEITAQDVFNDSIETNDINNAVARSLIAELLSTESKAKTKAMFTIDMRLAFGKLIASVDQAMQELRRAALTSDWKSIKAEGILKKQLGAVIGLQKKKSIALEKITELGVTKAIASPLIEAVDQRTMELGAYLGETLFPQVAVGDKVTMLDVDEEGNVSTKQVEWQASGDKFNEYVKAIRRTMEILKNPKHSAKYDQAYIEYWKQAYALIEEPLMNTRDASYAGSLFAMLESFSQTVSRAGTEEALMITSMFNKLNTDLRLETGRFVQQGHRTAKAFRNLQKVLRNSERSIYNLNKGQRYSLEDIRNFLYDPFMTFVEGQIDAKRSDLVDLASEFWKQKTKEATPGTIVMNRESREAWLKLITEVERSNDMVVKLAERLGLPIEDEVQIVDPILHNRTLFRDRIPMSDALTVPRRINYTKLSEAAKSLQQDGSDIITVVTSAVRQKIEEDEDYSPNAFKAQLAAFDGLNGDVTANFLDAVFEDDNNPRNLGWDMNGQPISMQEIRMAWESSVGANGGARLADMIHNLAVDKDLPKYFNNISSFLEQLQRRSQAIIRENNYYNRQINQREKNPKLLVYKQEAYGSLTGRKQGNVLPGVFYEYNMMTEIDMRQTAARLLLAHHFGRKEEKFLAAFDQLSQTLEAAENEFSKIYRKASPQEFPFRAIDNASKSHPELSSKFNLQAFNKYGVPPSIKKKLSTEEYARLRELYTLILSLRQAKKVLPNYKAYANDQSSFLGDERLPLEILQTASTVLVAKPNSAVMNLASLFQLFQYYDLNPTSVKSSLKVLKGLSKEVLDTVVQSFGSTMGRNLKYGEKALAPLWTQQDSATEARFDFAGASGNLGDVDYSTKTGISAGMRKFLRAVQRGTTSGLKIPKVNNKVINMILNGVPGREKLAEEGELTTPPGSLSTFSLIPGVTNVFSWLNNAVLKQSSLAILADLRTRVELAAHVLDTKSIPVDDLNYQLTKDDLGYTQGMLGLAHKDTMDVYERIDRELADFGLSVTRLAQDFRKRRKEDITADPITDENKKVAAYIASTRITFDGASAKAQILQTKLGIFASPLLGWTSSMAAHANRLARQPDGAIDFNSAQTYKALGVYATLFAAIGIPISLAVFKLAELYDEEYLGRESGVGDVPAYAYLPFGSLLGISDPAFRTLSFVERLGRTSSAGGFYQETLTNLLLQGTGEIPKRDLLQRVLGFGILYGAGNAMVNYYNSLDVSTPETFIPDYASVVRPLMYVSGLGNVVQFSQFANNFMPAPIFSSEYEITNLLNKRRKLRAYTKALGIETSKSGSVSYSMTPMTRAIRKMERAAYAGNRESFLEAYRLALQLSTADDPAKDIMDRFKRRNLKSGISKYALSDSEWNTLMSVLDNEDRSEVQDGLMKHSYYLQLIGGTPAGPSRTSRRQIDELKRRALL